MFDVTKIEKPFGLLTKEEKEILKRWPHGFEFFMCGKWQPLGSPAWNFDVAYRGCAAARTVSLYGHVNEHWEMVGMNPFPIGNSPVSVDTHKITFDIVNGKVVTDSIKIEEL